MIKIDTILFPTDFSDFSKHAMLYAASFAREYGAKVYVLHVIEEIAQASYYDMLQVPLPPNLLTDMEQNARQQVADLLEAKEFEGIETEGLIRRGVPFLEIIGVAAETGVDLITIATHGRVGLKHALFGSTAEKVVRKAPCPVLSVRHPEHEFVMPDGTQSGGQPASRNADS